MKLWEQMYTAESIWRVYIPVFVSLFSQPQFLGAEDVNLLLNISMNTLWHYDEPAVVASEEIDCRKKLHGFCQVCIKDLGRFNVLQKFGR